jgi:peptidylprolyl isomerase
LPGFISALVVLAVLGLVGFIIFTRANPATETAAQPTIQAVPTISGAPTIAAQPTAAAPAIPVADKPTYDAPPPLTINPERSYTATIATPRGDIVIQLRPDLAPETVNSFVFLAREGFFDGLTWHRVIPGFVAQGGDPLGTGTGGPGYNVPDEYTSEVLFDRAGLVAMASTGPGTNSGGSQFFITLAPTPNLNEQYTIFGEVIEGLDIVEGIPEREPATATSPGEQMLSVTITEE